MSFVDYQSSASCVGGTTATGVGAAHNGSTGSLKLKVPTWTQAQLKEAIQAVVTQQMRFTQASTHFGIPKGTLYDNILGKTKRMQALEEAGLTLDEETAVLEFCCQISESPYNRRTRKSLSEVLNFVQTLRQRNDAGFEFKGLAGFRWWWAFCKKHSIVSLHYSGATIKCQEYDDQPYDFSTRDVPKNSEKANYGPLQQYLKLSVESSLASFGNGNGDFSPIQEIHAKTSPICH